jgi:hypothetical protein
MKAYQKIQYCLGCFFFFLIMGQIAAQPVNKLVNDVVMPAPNAAALGKYSDIPVSYSTGVPNISIPIYTVQDGSVSLPISLSYHASGIKVGEPASWVGQGWSLNAGGIISRTVLGLPDEALEGYLTTGKDMALFRFNGTNKLRAGQGKYDTEPDLFSFNVGGYTGKFYFAVDDVLGDAIIPIVTVPMQDVKVEIINGSSISLDIQGFVITDPNGVKYTFGSADARNAIERTGGAENGGLYASAWYLLKIESPDKTSAIHLFYDDEHYIYESLRSCSYTVSVITSTCISGPVVSNSSTGPDCPALSVKNAMSGKKLREIKTGKNANNTVTPSATAWVQFKANTVRDDLEPNPTTYPSYPAKRLDNIEISSGTTVCKKFEFSYDYFEDSRREVGTAHAKRLQLQALREVDCTGTTKLPPHVFSYEGYSEKNAIGQNRIFLPNRLSKAIDHWGFYNAETSNEYEKINIPYTEITDPSGKVIDVMYN